MEHICVTCFDFWEYSRSFESQWNNVIPAKVEEEWFCNEYKTRRDHLRTFRRQLISRLSRGAKNIFVNVHRKIFLFYTWYPSAFCLKIFRAPRVYAFIGNIFYKDEPGKNYLFETSVFVLSLR